jgi:hypothetical protein
MANVNDLSSLARLLRPLRRDLSAELADALLKGPNLSSVDPETKRVVRLFHPRRDRWSDHFGLDAGIIVGKTPVGRATAFLFRMNDGERHRVRSLSAGV